MSRNKKNPKENSNPRQLSTSMVKHKLLKKAFKRKSAMIPNSKLNASSVSSKTRSRVANAIKVANATRVALLESSLRDVSLNGPGPSSSSALNPIPSLTHEAKSYADVTIVDPCPDLDPEPEQNTEVLDMTSSINMIEIESGDDRNKLLIVNSPDTLSFDYGDHHIYQLCQKRLDCDIHGYKLGHAPDRRAPTFLSTGFGSFHVVLQVRESQLIRSDISLPEGITLNSSVLQLIESEMETNSHLLVLLISKPLANQHIAYLEMYASKLFPRIVPKETDKWPHLKQITPQIAGSGLKSLVGSMRLWSELYDALKISPTSVVILCGGKDVGKSSVIRYLINRYLSDPSVNGGERSKRKTAYLFDCDPGQTEFTPPGATNITAVDEPIICPKFISQILFHKKNLLSSSVCGSSAGHNPIVFASAIADLFRRHVSLMRSTGQASTREGPLFVNTMGWPRELGFRLFVDVMTTVQPTHLVQIHSLDPKLNFAANLRPVLLDRQRGVLSKPYPNRPKFNFRLLELTTKLNPSELKFNTKSFPLKQRVSAQLAYLSLIPEGLFLPSVLVHRGVKIPLSGMSFHFAGGNNQFRELTLILQSLHYQWVQLCHVNLRSIPERDRFRVANHANVQMHCLSRICENILLGCGIVRSDVSGPDGEGSQLILEIITPEPEEKLQQMLNCIVKPDGIFTPDFILEEQESFTDKPKFISRQN